MYLYWWQYTFSSGHKVFSEVDVSSPLIWYLVREHQITQKFNFYMFFAFTIDLTGKLWTQIS